MVNIDLESFSELLPESKSNLKRLKYLFEDAGELRVAVFGKYNHGKSTLLNALVGEDVFKTADKRETVVNAEHKSGDIVWVDTPGLDADVHGKDDKEAMEGAFKVADFLFLVHNVKTGELDKNEMQLYSQLMRQDKNYKKKMFLILTQVDQVDDAQLELIVNKIHYQLPDLKVIPVSAIRYMKGRKEEKALFIEKSGMPELLEHTETLKIDLGELREKEQKRLKEKVIVELEDVKKDISGELGSAQHRLKKQKSNLKSDIRKLFKNIEERI